MREGVGVYSSHASVVTFDYGERQDADRDSCSCVTKTSLHCMLHPAHMCVCVYACMSHHVRVVTILYTCSFYIGFKVDVIIVQGCRQGCRAMVFPLQLSGNSAAILLALGVPALVLLGGRIYDLTLVVIN